MAADGDRNEFTQEHGQQLLQSDSHGHSAQAAETPHEQTLEQVYPHQQAGAGSQGLQNCHGREFVPHEPMDGAGNTDPAHKQ